MANEELVVQLRADINDLRAKLREAMDAIAKFGTEADDKLKKPLNPMKQLRTSLEGLIGGFVGLQAAMQLVGRAFQESMQVESLKSAFTAILGSAELADAELKRISDTADYLGLNFLDLASSFKNFAASALGSGQSLEKTNELFDAFTKTAAVLKMSSEDVKLSLNALGQMFSKGTVSAEELKQQLGERLPGTLQLFSKALGISTRDLNKMMEQGQLMASELIKLSPVLNEVYGNKITQKVNTLAASVQTLNNTFTKLVQNGAIGWFFKVLIDGVNKTIFGIQVLSKMLMHFGDSIYEIDFKEQKKSYDELYKSATKPLDLKNQDKLKTQQGELSMALEQNKKLLESGADVYGKNSKEVKDLNAQNVTLVKTLSQVNKALKPVNVDSGNNLKSIEGLTNEIKKQQAELNKLDEGTKAFFKKDKEIDALQKKLKHAQDLLNAYAKGTKGEIEFVIKVKEDELQKLKPNSEAAKKLKSEIKGLKESLEEPIDFSSMDGIDKSIESITDQLNKLPKGSKEIDDLVKQLQYLNITKENLNNSFIPPPVGLFNTYQAELSKLEDAQKQALSVEDYQKIGVEIDLLKQKMEGLTVTTLTNAQAFKAIWQDVFASFTQGIQAAFAGALWSGKNFASNFGKMFVDMLKQMMARLAAAIVMAAILFALLSAVGMANGGGIAEGAKFFGMKGVPTYGSLLGGALGISNKTVTPTASTGQGTTQIDIMGDKMRMLLDNTAIKNSRVI